MKEFDSLQEIWKQQKQSTLPDVSVIIAKAKKEKQTVANKILFQVITLVLSMVGVIWVVATVDFKMITTFIGIGLMFICVFGFSAIRLYQMVTLNKIDLTQSPSKTLVQLEQFYTFQQFVGTKIMLAYFVVLNIAFAFYFIEVMQPMSTLLKTIVIITYVAWMLVAYFFIGKKQKAREYERTQRIINSIKEMEQKYQE
jgi:hypothetical protein